MVRNVRKQSVNDCETCGLRGTIPDSLSICFCLHVETVPAFQHSFLGAMCRFARIGIVADISSANQRRPRVGLTDAHRIFFCLDALSSLLISWTIDILQLPSELLHMVLISNLSNMTWSFINWFAEVIRS